MTTQLAIRFSDRTLALVDGLIAAGEFASRAEAVRTAVDQLVRDAERRAADAAVVAGYGALPDAPTDTWLEAATRAMVSAEPW